MKNFVVYKTKMCIFARIFYNQKEGNTMCKQTTAGTYLNVNALSDNAQRQSFPDTITVGHILV